MYTKLNIKKMVLAFLCIILAAGMVNCSPKATSEPTQAKQVIETAIQPPPVVEEPTAAQPTPTVPKEPTKATVVISGDPETFNVNSVGRAVVQLASEMVLLSVAEVDPYGNYFPELAESIPTIENGGVVVDEVKKTMDVTWKLKQNVQWADGVPVTADDVIFTWNAFIDPVTGSGGNGEEYVDSIEKIDDYTFVMHYNALYTSYITQLGGQVFVIWPKHYCDVSQGFTTWDCNRKPLSDGPYILQEWIPDDHLTFVRNPLYFEKGKPYIDTIVFQIVPDQNVRKTMMIEGSADANMYLSESVTKELEQQSNVKISFAPSNRWVMRLMPNLAAKGFTDPVAHPHPILSDVRVRQAIRMAIDVDTIVDKIFLGYSVPVWTEFYREPYVCDIPRPKYDPEGAAALLAEAGWIDQNGDGVRECHGCTTGAEEGYPLSMEFMIYAEYGESLNLSQQMIGEELGKIGFDLQLAVEEGSVMWADFESGGLEQIGDFDLNMWDEGYAGVDPTPMLESYYSSAGAVPGKGRNVGRWISPEFDALLVKAQTPDETTRKEVYCQMAKLLDQELPMIPLWSILDAASVSSRMEGIQATINDVITWNVADWKIIEQ